jgi:predicted enzyme related to lactoylglutathione lyase
MAIEQMYATIYYVDDWDASLAFYRDVVGLTPLHVERGWAEFQVGTVGRLALHARDSANPANVTKVSLQVRDVDGTLHEMRRKGARVVEPVRREEFGAVATVADPSGNLLGLYEPR